MSIGRPHSGDQDPGAPVGRLPGSAELRRSTRSTVVAHGTLACPSCDAPVSPGVPLAPSAPLACPLCDHRGLVRDFLSLAAPTRPARVRVVVSLPGVAVEAGD